jgi:hypothetical protein
MFENRSENRLTGTPLSRRTVLRSAGAIGLAGALAVRGEVLVSAQEATPGAVDYPEVVITAIEYSFDMPASIPGGLTKLTLDNQGTMDHHAMFLRVHDDATLEDVKSALQSGQLGPVFAAATSVGGPSCGPGHRASVIADLPAGHYTVICAIPDEDNVPHYAKGMMSDLEVTEATTTATAPTADATVTLSDFMFTDLPMNATAGSTIWEIDNAGPQLHEIVICQIQPGFTFDQIDAMLTAPPATPAAGDEAATAAASPMAMMGAPFVGIGGAAPMSAGQTNYALLDLVAGDYFAICFVPDQKTGAPHFALGMIMPFTVAA